MMATSTISNMEMLKVWMYWYIHCKISVISMISHNKK